jgi:CDP-diacylglycerol--serine O-phosphatidyltransferase
MHDGADSGFGDSEAVVVRKRRKGIYILPNLFTLAALFGGFYAIVMAMNGRYDLAAVGIFCAMVLDSLDGRVARMTNTQSAFGEQMDSLSDMVSFGAAPALISYVWALKGLGRWGWIAAFVYCACAALRLARFNVNTGVVDKRYFQGLPSPAAAALVAGFIWLMTDLGIKGSDQCAVLQLQGRAHEKKRAVCRDRADRPGNRGDQYRSPDRVVWRLRALWREWLCDLHLASLQRRADQCDQHVDRGAG